MEDARNLFLFVFFAQDRHDGYLWFSSLKEDIPRHVPQPQQAPGALKISQPSAQ